jgi:DNA-binding MarR family transcriptional regulator
MHPSDVEEVSDAVLTASRVLVAIAAQSLRGLDNEVTLQQYRTLVVLQSRGPQSLQALASELQVVPSTATRMCDRLVGKGLIRRRGAAGSRREIELSITQEGAALVGRVARERRNQLRRIVREMEPAARSSLVAALEDFARAAGEVPEEQWYLGWS